MENRPAPLRSRRVCRFCLTESEPLSFIYEKDNNRQFQVPLTLQIISCVGIEVYAADGMPQMICNMCRWNLDRSYKFKLQCKKADEALRAYPLSGVLPRPFPPIPNDPPEVSGKRPAEQRSQNEGKKPRMETREREREREKDRERERERERDRDRDRERDRQSDKQRDKSDYYEEEQESYRKGFRNSTKLTRHSSSHSEERPFPCKLCSRTFLLAHHLARHMRTHSVEKRHVCEDCGKAFKRKESLEVHQLTHTKRTGMGLTCDVCQESCRNRADYVTHIKQHIEAGEKMGPDGLQPDNKSKYDMHSDEEEEEDEEEQYSDGDDDYHPPAYLAKKIPVKVESEEEAEHEQEPEGERVEKEERKEQVVYVRNKDGSMIKKTIKTLMPIQRRDVQDTKAKQTNIGASSSVKATSSKVEEAPKGRVDETEAQVQKIVASVFKEHKIPLKHQNAGQEQDKESSNTSGGNQVARPQTSQAAQQLVVKEEKSETPAVSSGTPKVINTVKVIKRIVVRKPGNSNNSAATPTTSLTSKESEPTVTPLSTSTPTATTTATTTGGHKVTKRVIVRRIIRQGDTTREVIMNPDGTLIDPSELAKLPTGNVVKRLIVKKPVEKAQGLVQTVVQPSTDTPQSSTSKANDSIPIETKFELKTSQSSSSLSSASNSAVIGSKKPSAIIKDDQETKEKLEQLEKRVEQQRLQIEELQARKQQEYEAIDEMLPERHDESEDEQQLPLKRVFVKRKQSIYDEEQEYNDDEKSVTETFKTKDEQFEGNEKALEVAEKPSTPEENVKADESLSPVTTVAISSSAVTLTPRREGKQPILTSSKVYSNKKIIVVKAEISEVEDTSQNLEILDTDHSDLKIEENVLTNLSEIPAEESSEKTYEDNLKECMSEPTKTDTSDKSDDANRSIELEAEISMDVVKTEVVELKQQEEQTTTQVVEETESQKESSTLTLDSQDLSESADIFEPSDNVLDIQKGNNTLDESVIELKQSESICLNDTNDTQDSLEDKLSQMEG